MKYGDYMLYDSNVIVYLLSGPIINNWSYVG